MLSEKIEQYISEKVENLKNELKKEVEEMVTNEANKTKTVWGLKKADEERYYHLFSDGVIDKLVFNTDYDKQARDMGNAFLTREEAEFEVERRKIEAVMRRYSRPFKIGVYNHIIKYNQSTNTVFASADWSTNTGTVYFESEEIAKKVINEIGEDRLLKYWFGVNNQSEDN